MKQVYLADGVTFEFPIPFEFDRVADVSAFVTRADGSERELIQNQDYVVDTVTAMLVTRVDDNSDPLAAGITLTIARATPMVQPSGRSAMSAKVFRTRLESLTRVFQELREQAQRTLQIGQDYPALFRNTAVYTLAVDLPDWPYVFFAVRSDGTVNTSMDGQTFVAGTAIPTVLAPWQFGAFSPETNRFMIGLQAAPVADVFQVAYTDDGDNWTVLAAPAVGVSGQHCKMIWTTTFGGGRWYAQFRQSGSDHGGIWYSDDGGATWAAVTWPGGLAGGEFLDVQYLAISDSRIVCMGRFFSDSNTIKRIYYSTNGVDMVAGVNNITTLVDFGGADGLPRGAQWIPRLGQFVFTGTSGSSADSAIYITTADGTSITGPFAMAGPEDPVTGEPDPQISRGVRSGDVIDAFSTIICSCVSEGADEAVFLSSAEAEEDSWSAVDEADMGSAVHIRPTQLALSPSLGRVVTACNAPNQGFLYADAADSWSVAAATAGGEWRCIVATR